MVLSKINSKNDMEKLLLTLLFCITALTTFAQTKEVVSDTKTKTAQIDSLLTDILLRLENIEYNTEPATRYKLYKTENIYNLLKLDTATGQIVQLQWSLNDDKEGTITINSENLSLSDKQAGTFELYPTNNMYQFILLDTITGRTWHVQWGIGAGKRWIRRIY